MFVIISYDIVANRTRNKVMKYLKDYGDHVQLSVFECVLDSVLLERIKEHIESLIDGERDSVRYYPLCKGCVGRVETLGWGDPPTNEPFEIV